MENRGGCREAGYLRQESDEAVGYLAIPLATYAGRSVNFRYDRTTAVDSEAGGTCQVGIKPMAFYYDIQ